MRRGSSLAHTGLLQHVNWDPSSSSISCKAATNLSARSSSLALVSKKNWDFGTNSNKGWRGIRELSKAPNSSFACFDRRCCRVDSASSIASSCFSSGSPLSVVSGFGCQTSSSSSVVSGFGSPLDSGSARGHRTLNFGKARQQGRSLALGGSLLITWRRGNKFSSRGFGWWSTTGGRLWTGSIGQGVGFRQEFCLGRAELAAMAASGGAPEGYRPNVGLCLVNERDEVFVASRLDIPDCWQMPQGGVDDGEDPCNAAIRELREETGVTSVQLIREVPDWLTYDFPPDVGAKLTGLYGTVWKGQAQKWFLFRFTGDESEITLAGDGSEKPEFGDWKWLPAGEVLKLAVDFKRPAYEKAFKDFAVHIASWSKM